MAVCFSSEFKQTNITIGCGKLSTSANFQQMVAEDEDTRVRLSCSRKHNPPKSHRRWKHYTKILRFSPDLRLVGICHLSVISKRCRSPR